MKRIAAAIAVALFLAAGAIGVTAQDTGPQAHNWVNFSTGYANSAGTHGNAQVHLIGVSGYQPSAVRYVVDDNGGSHTIRVAHEVTCWDEGGLTVTYSGDVFVNPAPYVKSFFVPFTSDRCEINVLAINMQTGTNSHIDVTSQAGYTH